MIIKILKQKKEKFQSFLTCSWGIRSVEVITQTISIPLKVVIDKEIAIIMCILPLHTSINHRPLNVCRVANINNRSIIAILPLKSGEKKSTSGIPPGTSAVVLCRTQCNSTLLQEWLVAFEEQG